MGVAFSDLDMETIRKKLKARARECLAKYGIQKTAVKDIVSAASISVGAFYRFYDSKERLFFEVMEDMDAEIYAIATEILKTRTELSLRERVILSLISSYRKINEMGYMQVWKTESAYMMRKLPAEVLADHYKDEGSRIVDILSEFGIKACLPAENVAMIFQCLLASLSQPMEIEAERSQVSEFMIRAICEKLFPDSLK